MRVLLKLVLECDPDAAWKAIRSPKVFRQVSAPLIEFESLDAGGFPEFWGEGEHRVRGRALGFIPVGDQLIDISYPMTASLMANEVRMTRDSGRGLTGLLSLVTTWEHSMTIAPTLDGDTLYRDQLKFSVGPLTIVAWPFFWAFWQWRGKQITRLAHGWDV